MRAREILENASAATTTAGSIATATQPLGLLTRSDPLLKNGKYLTTLNYNNVTNKGKDQHARRKFKNSPGH